MRRHINVDIGFIQKDWVTLVVIWDKKKQGFYRFFVDFVYKSVVFSFLDVANSVIVRVKWVYTSEDDFTSNAGCAQVYRTIVAV